MTGAKKRPGPSKAVDKHYEPTPREREALDAQRARTDKRTPRPSVSASMTDGAVVVSATFRGEPGEPAAIQAEMDRIATAREESQPLRSKTGGSTFKNPDGHKAWALVDEAGCRGLQLGGAQVSEKHTNFLLNTGDATSADIEALGEEVRRRVKDKSGVELEWEIQRVGLSADDANKAAVELVK